MKHRLFHLSLMSLLLLSAVQFAQPWETFADESAIPQESNIVTVMEKHDRPITSITVPLIEAVPDQGRPQGRLRGGGSR